MSAGQIAIPTDVTRGSLRGDQVAAMLDALTRHFGERVAPASDYCQGFYDWQSAVEAKVARLKDRTEANYGSTPEFEEHQRQQEVDEWTAVLDAIRALAMPIGKSSMLARRVYGGEILRTRMCPAHKGRWVGIGYCPHGCDQTGWLPA